MRVLSFSFNDSKGGAAISAHRIHTLLRKGNIDSKMIVARKFTNDFSVCGPENNFNRIVQIFRQKFSQILIFLFFRKPPSFISLSLFPSFWHKYINNSNVNLVHLHWINLEFMSISDISKIKKPIIWTLHDMWAFSGAQHLVWNNDYEGKYSFKLFGKLISNLDYLVWKRKYRAFDNNIIIVTPSKWLANCAQKSTIFKNNEIFVIPNPINIENWNLIDKNCLREKYFFTKSEKLILFSTAEDLTNHNKGFDLLLKSLTKIPVCHNFKLLIIGQSKPKYLKNYSFDIIFIGKVNNLNDLNSIYRLVDFVVLPSRQENLSNVAIEALANERPVIAFDYSGNTDIIKNGINGYLIEPYNTIKMSIAIIDLLTNTNRCLEFGINGREFVINNFENKVVFNKYLELYKYATKRYR
jgi:glycosyltransferase involved in cell wall biosynthesis